MTAYTRKEFIQKIMHRGDKPKTYFLFAGENYVPGKIPFTTYEEFDSFADFLKARQSYMDQGYNVFSFGG